MDDSQFSSGSSKPVFSKGTKTVSLYVKGSFYTFKRILFRMFINDPFDSTKRNSDFLIPKTEVVGTTITKIVTIKKYKISTSQCRN